MREPERLEQPDVRRHQDDHEGERQQQALDQLDGHVGRAPRPSVVRARPSTTRSSPIPRDALTRTTSPSRRRGRQRVDGGLGVADPEDRGRRPARRPARPRRSPRRPARRRPASRRSGRRPRRPTRWPSSLRLAELEHLAEDGDRAGRAARPAGRAPRRPSAARRCSVSSTIVTPPARTSCDAVRRRPAGGEAVGDLVERAARRRGRPRRAASALWTDSRPRVGIVTGRRRRVGAQDEAHPVEPGRFDRLGARRRRRPRTRRSRLRAAVRRCHPADDRVVGVEDRRCRRGGQRLEQLALGRLDRLDASRSATGGPAGPRSRRRSAAGRSGPGRRSRRRRTSPSRGRPPRAPGRGAGRVSGRPDLVVLVALVAQRPEAPRRGPPRSPPWSRSWRCSRSRRRPAGRTGGASRRRSAPSAASGSATRTTVTSPSVGRVGDRAASTTRAAAPRGDRVGEERVAVGPLAGQGDEQLARLDQPRVDGGAADRSVGPGEEPAAGQRGRGRRRSGRAPAAAPATGARRIDVGHGRQCRTGRAHRSAVRVGVDRPVGQQVRRRDRVGGDPPEQLERHDRHLQVADPGDRRACPPRSGSRRRGPGRPVSRPM